MRKKALKALLKSPGKTRSRRAVIENSLVTVRQWLALDNFNSFPIPKAAMDGRLKGELFRFYLACLFLAAKYGNPFNQSDNQFIREFGFHASRLHLYKRELEEMKLIEVALIKNPKLKWAKCHYLIIEFWNG